MLYSFQEDWCSRTREINIPKSVIISVWPKKNVIIKTKSYKGSGQWMIGWLCFFSFLDHSAIQEDDEWLTFGIRRWWTTTVGLSIVYSIAYSDNLWGITFRNSIFPPSLGFSSFIHPTFLILPRSSRARAVPVIFWDLAVRKIVRYELGFNPRQLTLSPHCLLDRWSSELR